MLIAAAKDEEVWVWAFFAFIMPPMALFAILAVNSKEFWAIADTRNGYKTPAHYNYTHNNRTEISKSGEAAYKASLKAGNTEKIAKKDSLAAKRRIRAQNKIRRRYTCYEVESSRSKTNSRTRKNENTTYRQ